MTRAAIAVAAAALGLAACGAGGTEAAPDAGPPRGWTTYRDRDGWLVRHPPRFRSTRVVQVEENGSIEGAAFTSFRLGGKARFEPLELLSGSFPATGVFVAFATCRQGIVIPRQRDTRIPLALGRFSQAGGSPPVLRTEFQAHGEVLCAFARIGSRARASLRRDLARVVASFRFPPLRRGGATRTGWHVAGRPRDFAPGSVTRLTDVPPGQATGRAETFFLVRTKGGFHTISTPAGVPGFERCRLRYVPARRQFTCLGIRWNIFGVRVAGRGGPQWPLHRWPAPISYDGWVLV